MVMPPETEEMGGRSDMNMGNVRPLDLSQQEAGSLNGKVYYNHSTSWTPPASATSVSTHPSRKRSRDFSEYNSNNEGSHYTFESVNTPASIPEESIYGEDLARLHSSTSLSVSADSQSGAWGEEKAGLPVSQTLSASDAQEIAPTRKVIRLDPATPAIEMDDPANNLAPDSPPKSSKLETPIDDFTYALGIGWTRVSSDDPDMEAAARGWARYLENHYSSHVQDAQILLRSKGLNAYLVASRQGFYLFSENLTEGRLVGRHWDVTLSNLRTHPIAFEGGEVLRVDNGPTSDSSYLMGGIGQGSSLNQGTSRNNHGPPGSAQMEVD